MKRTILTLAILIAATISIAGQSKDEQAIRQYFNELDQMLVTDEAGAAEKLTGDDFIFIGGNGGKSTKAEQVANIKNSTWGFASVKRDIESVRASGNLAVVVSYLKFVGKGKKSGNTFNGGLRQTTVLEKRGGRWTGVSAQTVRDIPNINENELNKFVDDYAAALTRNSADDAAKFLASDYTRIGPDGSVASKDEHLASVRSGDLKYQSIESTDRKWRILGFGSAAIVTSRLALKAGNKGRDVSGNYLLTTVLRRSGIDRWEVVSTQISPLAASN